MISGREALGVIRQAVTEEQARSRQVEARLSEASQALLQVDQERARALSQLARLRVEALAEGGVAERLDEADRRVLATLEQRSEEVRLLHAELAGVEARQAEGAAARERHAEALEAAAAAVDAAEAGTQARLAADPDYRAQRDATEAAERIAVHADEKATLAEQERAAKGAAYDADPLFAYLWRRGYGTAAYRAWPLVRWLDGKVARLIGFEAARRNYQRLQELPLRLREHADRVGAQADAALSALAARDAAEREADGVAALEAEHERARARLAAADERLEADAQALQAVQQRIETYARGDDPRYLQAVAALAEALGQVPLRTLAREAIATPFPEDDRIVARLLELDRQREAQAATLTELREAAAGHRNRTTDLERVRIDFSRRRFDQPDVSFPDAAMIATLLAQLLNGAMTRDALWRVLEKQRQVTPRRADPTFGSGGFGRASPWGGGLPGGLPGRLPTGGFGGTGRAGGGAAGKVAGKVAGEVAGRIAGSAFRTAGKIASGAFKTGGKF